MNSAARQAGDLHHFKSESISEMERSEGESGRNMLELQSVSKSYRGIPAVEDVSFILQPGDVLGYLGPNGSGKSTTVKMVIGMIRPTRGKVLFAGKDIHGDLAGYRAQLGYVPEEAQVYTHLSGMEYLQLVGRLRGMAEGSMERKARELLHLLSLETAQYSPMTEYSKGMKQRVLIAAALLHDPKLIVFDEPLSGLDAVSARLFKDLLVLLAKEGKSNSLHLACAGGGGAGVPAGDHPVEGQSGSRCPTTGAHAADGAA